MNEKLLRTFLSVSVPKDVLRLRDMLKTTVDDKGSNIHWVRDGNIHLTLKFIGHTPENDVEKINTAINRIINETRSMKFTIEETGCFPKPERPRIMWLGMKGDLDELQRFVQKLNDTLSPLGYPHEEKEFIPHLTMARIKYPQKKTPDISAFLNTKFEPISMNIAKIQLMRSELFSNGSVYTILGTHFLT